MIKVISSILNLVFLALICGCATAKPISAPNERTCLDQLLEMGEFNAEIEYFRYSNLSPLPCPGKTYGFRFANREVGQEYTKYILENFDHKTTLSFVAKVKISGYANGELFEELVISSFALSVD